MRLDWLENTATQEVMGMLEADGHKVFAVGGCVRNALLGLAADDVDLATSARPEQVRDLFDQKGFKAIPTGIDHGTITVVRNEIPFEITTFRKDIATDGRHAKVMFSDNALDDAQRRDFTMNALYMTRTGEVIDPLGQMSDLHARRVRFVGEASERVTEDFLRILRFFRFHAWYGDPEKGIDEIGLAACAEHSEGLAKISKERITSEIIKLLRAKNPAPSVASMQASGVLAAISEGADHRPLAPLVHLSEGWEVDPILRLASLGGNWDLKLSNAQSKQLALYKDEIGSMRGPLELGYRYGQQIARGVMALRAAIFETPMSGLGEIERGAQAKLPITSADLMPKYQGPALGVALRRAEGIWIASGMQLGKAALIKELESE